MKKLLLTLVIINPYYSINYDDVTVYDLDPYEELEIVETLGDGYKDPEPKRYTVQELSEILQKTYYDF